MHQRYPNGERAIARKPSAERRERAPDETHRENRLPPRGFRPIPRPLASRAAARAGASRARETAAAGWRPLHSRTTFPRTRGTRPANARTRESRRRVFPVLRADTSAHAIAAGSRVSAVCARDTRTANARMRAPSACCSRFPRRQARSNEHCRESRVCHMCPRQPTGKRATRGSRQPVILILRADKPAHAIAAGSRVSVVCVRNTRTANARMRAPSACCSHFPRGQAHSNEHCRKSRVCRIRLRQPAGKHAARGSRQHVILILRADKPAHAIAAGSRVSAVCARNTRTATVRMRAPSTCCSHFPRRQAHSNEHCRKSRVCRMRLQHPNGKRATRGSRQHVILILRADKPAHAIAAGSRVSAVCARDTRTANARTRGSRQRDEGSVRRMKRIVKIGFRHADSVPFRAPSHPAPQYARRLYAPAKLPLWESNLSIRERHSCASAIPERQPHERARRRHVVLAFRVDKPIPTNIAGSRASAVYACSTRTANAQRAEAVSPLSSFSARTSPPTQSLPEVACLSYAPATPERRTCECARRRRVVLAFRVDKPIPTNIAGSRASAVYACSTRTANAQRAEAVSPLSSFSARTSPPTQSLPEVTRLSYAYAIPERQPRECARRRHVVLAFRVDKPVPTNITGSRASAICARGNRPANAQRAEAVSTLSSFSARTRPPTQSLPEVAYLPYAPATPERQTRERAGAVSGTKGACAG